MEALAGEEMERALMDLGPLLGVSIKEEAPDESGDPTAAAAAAATTNAQASGSGGGGGEAAETSGGGEGGAGAGADSLASPGRAPLSGARCVLCAAPLALQDGTPKLMECLHSACEPCIKAKVEEKLASSNGRDFLGAERVTITCPVCKLQCQPSNMIDQRFVLEKIALEQAGGNEGSTNGEQQCNSCEDSEPATSYCVDCAEFICDNCVHAHQRLKITKDHTIKTKDEALADLHAAASQTRNAHDMFCREHPQERLSLFCETCDRLTCRDCQLQHHRDHKYQFSTEMAAQARASIGALLSEVSYKRVLLGSAMKVIRERQQLIADKKKALVHEITQVVVKLTNAINSRGKQLVLRLSEVCDGKLRTLADKRDALTALATVTDHCLDFVSAALDQGSDTALLYSKRAVCAHLQRIKARRADIPNPEIPVRIALALDPLPDVLRVLSTIGAIVVDGKMDGGAGGAGGGGGGGGAQGPYHPPAAAPAPPAPAAPHSAVVALQHAAMHQSYVAGVSNANAIASGYLAGAAGVGGAGGGGGVRGRPPNPLRHPHVTSTTHPHHLHGMSELNLRGLLTPAGGAVRSARGQLALQHGTQHLQHSMQHAYQQMMGAYAYGSGSPSGRRSGGPRTPSPAPPAYPLPQQQLQMQQMQQQQMQQQQQLQQQQQQMMQTQAHAKWHIPQHSLHNGTPEAGTSGSGSGGGGTDFKITLGRQHTPRQPALVTSTNPKTPSPSLNSHGGVPMELDKVCAESVQDLMATIAKLDSNGVQVVCETPAPASHVHSSTDHDPGKLAEGPGAPLDGPGSAPAAASAAGAGGGDPNEDWCAVCMDGGELMCCDKCPKVFHQYCHIPTIDKLPDETETWQCLLCVNFAELPEEECGSPGGLSARQQKLIERITLELYCQYEASLPFREPVPQDNAHYHSKIARPMCLDMIRMKLQPASPSRYSHPSHFVADCRLMFRNAYQYNPPESQIYKEAQRLEQFFDAQLEKWLPQYAHWPADDTALPPLAPHNKRPRLS